MAQLEHPPKPPRWRWLGVAYAVLALIGSLAFWFYFVIFAGNLPEPDSPWVRPSVDTGSDAHPVRAALIDLGLIALFGLQHSLMAREGFKARIRRILPQGLERATYVHAATITAFAIVLFWQPIPAVIWQVETGAWVLWTLFGIGWLVLLTSALSFGLLELHGIPQALAWARGQRFRKPVLKSGGWYDWLKHPMYAGVSLGLWATPIMTIGHLLLAGGLSAYLLIGMHYEERDLAKRFGRAYPAR